jgi:hypothetical protein
MVVRWIGFLVFLLGVTVHAAAPQMQRSILTRTEQFRVSIENWQDGNVSVSTDNGKTWKVVSRVLVPNSAIVHEVADGEFTASDWAPIGAIAATAVNAIHVKVDHVGAHATLFSILPRELITSRNLITSYLSQSSSIYVDVEGGSGLLGGQWAPRVGDPIFLSSSSNAVLIPWPLHRAPLFGDIITIISQTSSENEWSVEFENKVSGNVTFFPPDRLPQVIATVIKPFHGSGNFQGGIFQDVGKVRANHPGVIDISTSPYGKTGGIQIVPQYHSRSKNLAYVYTSPVYMLIAPVHADEFLEGQAPLFNGYIRPGSTVEAKINGVWKPFPESTGKQFEAFKDVEAIRIRSERVGLR